MLRPGIGRALIFLVTTAAAVVAVRAQSVPVTTAPALTYWCPMHPDERAASAIACPICRMTMVRIPPMRVGEYVMDVQAIAAPSGNGLAGVRIGLRTPSGTPVTKLETIHEKPAHLFIVSRDLEFFRHLHPDSRGRGTLTFREVIPAGEYMVIADFLPAGGTPQFLQRAIVAPGVARPSPPAPLGTAAGIHARMLPSAEFIAGSDTTVEIALTKETDGSAVRDLQPYLGAAAHLLIVSRDLAEAMHAHPDAPSAATPNLKFVLTLPKPGRYKAWLQVQRQNVVVTLPLELVAR